MIIKERRVPIEEINTIGTHCNGRYYPKMKKRKEEKDERE